MLTTTPWYPIITDSRNDDGEMTMPLRNEQGEDLLTTAESAAELGRSASTIRTLIQQGRLNVERPDARTVLIPRTELDRYRRESLGRPGRKSDTPTKTAKYSRAYRARKKAQPQGQQGEPPAED